MVKKFGRRLVAIAAAALMVTATAAPAFAYGYNYGFTFSGDGESQQEMGNYSKSDDEQNAYFTIRDSHNWSAGIDCVYLYVASPNGSSLTDRDNFYTHYIQSDPVEYRTFTGRGTRVRLIGWHNNNGNKKEFTVWGSWQP